ncbi:distal long tail fiber assembly catalyst [Escherichia phage JSE]|uniref:Receptor-recognizing protein gp38 n=1 Tax=Escherichia phage JSE TaxID=576789 RepID=C4MYP9_9CAUD|nr:tail fiber protein; host specificity [Escherichia phage JSE]ACL78030.1 distal long tail fiber assembly catalyst [Escherichia phage JSE]
MAISSGWVGSSAVSETGQRWMSAAMEAVRLGRPAYMSAMVGRSKEIHYSIGASNSYNKDTLINWMKAQGSTPVVITITGDIVSQSTGVPCLDFPSSLTNEYVTLIINSGVTVYGRGGNGGSNAAGAAGGNAINNAIGTRLRITNNGAIAGGGGGGGGGNRGRLVFGGGGGRPFGAGGSSSHMSSGATAGTISAPGKGSVGEGSLSAYTGGAGGNVGAAGGRCNTQGNGTEYNGGAAGKAVTGNAPRWDKVGTIYGARV